MENTRFIKIYANIPDKIRHEIVVIIDDKPYTWNSAYVEVSQNTKLGQRILAKLIRMELI